MGGRGGGALCIESTQGLCGLAGNMNCAVQVTIKPAALGLPCRRASGGAGREMCYHRHFPIHAVVG